MVDGVTVKAEDHELLTQGDKRVGTLRLTLPLHDAKISILATTRMAPASPLPSKCYGAGLAGKTSSTLYVLAIGVTHYKAVGLPKVHFPAKDAQDFVALTKAEQGGSVREGRALSQIRQPRGRRCDAGQYP